MKFWNAGMLEYWLIELNMFKPHHPIVPLFRFLCKTIYHKFGDPVNFFC